MLYGANEQAGGRQYQIIMTKEHCDTDPSWMLYIDKFRAVAKHATATWM